jgi:hypothetical protein
MPPDTLRAFVRAILKNSYIPPGASYLYPPELRPGHQISTEVLFEIMMDEFNLPREEFESLVNGLADEIDSERSSSL